MKIRRKMRHKRTHGVAWSLIVTTLACCIIAYGSLQALRGTIDSWLVDLPDVENSAAFNYALKTHVYAADGTTELASFYIENREPVTLENISPYVLKGTVATEDERFYEHKGVDIPGIARAVFVNLKGGELEGASTITQQFVRNTLLSEEARDLSLKRKVREAQLALNLEKIYSKDDILLMYLNTINYGDGCYGIEAAARNYFQKHATELTLVEAATLVGIPQSPTFLDPKTNPTTCLTRRNLVLERMRSYGTITKEECTAAQAEPLTLNPAPADAADGIYAYPFFTSYVKQLLLERFSTAEVFKGGLTVYTTLDPALQTMAESAAATQYGAMAEDLEVSLTAIDPHTGFIKAMIGGKDYYADQYNLATQSLRHAGSSFKVFTLVTAIEQGINPSTKINCSPPYTLNGWSPENYGGANYGIRSIQNATAISSNIGYARLIEQVTPEAAYETARRMGITSPELEPLPSMTLGTIGVNSLEMAHAYSVLAAGGVEHDPVAITQVRDAKDTVIFQHEDAARRVLSEEVSAATTKVLTTVFTEGTARAARLPSGQPAAGKTGTSENWGDSWLCAYTPQLSCATWIGARQKRSLPESLDCSNVWRNFMNAALAGQDIVTFPTKADPPYTNAFNNQQKQTYEEKPPTEEAPEQSPPGTFGMTLSEAAHALQGFEAEYVEEYSNTVAAGLVISQEVVNGRVRLHVSLGPNPHARSSP